MNGSPRPQEDKRHLAAFLRQLPAAIEELNSATEELLKSGWQDAFRRRAHNLAGALTESCSAHRLPQAAGVVRSIGSLIRLSAEEAAALRDALHEKLRELLSMLKDLGADAKRGAG